MNIILKEKMNKEVKVLKLKEKEFDKLIIKMKKIQDSIKENKVLDDDIKEKLLIQTENVIININTEKEEVVNKQEEVKEYYKELDEDLGIPF